VLARVVRGGQNAPVRSSSVLPRAALALAVALPLLAGACTTSTNGTTPTTSGGGPGSSAAPGGNNPTTTAPSSYADIAALAKALNDKGITCVLSYPGIKDDVSQAELSICTIDDEQAFLRVWQTPELVKTFLASPDGQTGTLAVGANWTISFQTPATATKVANALGGSAPGATTSGTAP
jgi:hypothetical protein